MLCFPVCLVCLCVVSVCRVTLFKKARMVVCGVCVVSFGGCEEAASESGSCSLCGLGILANLCCSAYDFSVWLLCVGGV